MRWVTDISLAPNREHTKTRPFTFIVRVQMYGKIQNDSMTSVRMLKIMMG